MRRLGDASTVRFAAERTADTKAFSVRRSPTTSPLQSLPRVESTRQWRGSKGLHDKVSWSACY